MRKLLPTLTVLMLVPVVFILAGCFTIADGTFRAFDVTLRSLSDVTGENQTVGFVENGITTVQGRYHVRSFTFNNNADRDAAAAKYEEYIKQQGYNDMPEQLFSIPNGTTIEVTLQKPGSPNTASVGIDTSFLNTLWIILIVNPN
jgi:Zn/Cd-binding protein ZinT